jgi:hypothetical protein
VTTFTTMRNLAALLLSLLQCAFSVGASASGLDDGEREAPKSAKCVEVRTLTPYRGYGYDHVVEIENRCTKTMSCTVKTDANPEAISVVVPARETRSVTTMRGSPAREFKADVQCKEL